MPKSLREGIICTTLSSLKASIIPLVPSVEETVGEEACGEGKGGQYRYQQNASRRSQKAIEEACEKACQYAKKP
jgi:hypothetical protein